MDGAILVARRLNGPMPQDREQHPAGPPGRRSVDCRLPEQVRHGGIGAIELDEMKFAHCSTPYEFPAIPPVIQGSALDVLECTSTTRTIRIRCIHELMMLVELHPDTGPSDDHRSRWR